MLDAAQDAAGKWVGESQRACEQRALSDQAEINKLGSDIDRAGNILNNTANAISPNRSTALSRVDGLEQDDFRVDDDWSVHETRNYAGAIAAAEQGSAEYNKLIAERDRRINDAINSTISLQALADQMGIDDQAGATALADAFSNAEVNAPLTAWMSRQQAARDVAAIAGGTATPQQKARFEAATDLSPEQRDALIQGNDAVITKGQFEYLQGFYGELNKQGLEGFTAFGGSDPAMKAALADGLQLLSNPHVRTDQQVDNWFGPIVSNVTGQPAPPSYIRGGLSQVPSAIRDPLTQNPVREGYTKVGGPGNEHFSGNGFPTLDELNSVADILGHGDPSQQLGSDIDRALIVRSGEIAGAAVENSNTGKWETDGRFAQVQDVLDKTIGIAANDHIAVHDALVTGTQGGHAPISAMQESIEIDGGKHAYDADESIRNLLAFDWDDEHPDSGGNNAITKFFDWIGQDADAPGYEGKLAGESADALAGVLIENQSELSGFLLDEDNPMTYRSLGEVNPGLTQTLATSMAPYLPNFVDVPDTITVNPYATELDSVTDLSTLFKVLDSDPTAAGIINTAGAQWQNHLAYQYGLDPDSPSLGMAAGQLDQAMKEGMLAEMDVLTANRQWDNIVDYNEDSMKYDTIYGILSAVLPEEISTPMSVLNPAAKFDMIDIPNDPRELARNPLTIDDVQTDSMTDPTIRRYATLEAFALESPQFRDYFIYDEKGTNHSFFRPDGRLDWEAIAENPSRFEDTLAIFNRAHPSLGLNQFEDEYAKAPGKDTIDYTSIPTPADPSNRPTHY
ncbi:TPR repeat region-containing protein [Gordonia rubripertincta]|uniref:TPR repeat domain-containing protein n=1 Tax=Gordonia rubripertincta TaxID=36822 RepID=A0ABT4MYI8_GORRU|nr:hypothetical protein [Gordonia rubripertincta]MCZ4551904.1 hypothetical protein [Gordonia rubripertincta]